mgnify:CR=1 FL=1
MNVGDLKKARIALERNLCDKIGSMLVEFQYATGVMVSDIEIEVQDFDTVSGKRTVIISSVKVKLDV